MNDLENHIISKDVLRTCQTVAQYACKKKCKTLITFLIGQYSDYYLNDNVLFIQFMVNRIRSIHECSHSVSKRIVRVSLCELFITMLQFQRKPKIKMISTNKTQPCSVPAFHMSFRNRMITNSTFMSGVKQLCNLDDTHEKIVNSLLFYCKRDYQSSKITEILSTLYRYKAIIRLSKVTQQEEMVQISEDMYQLPDNFNSILIFLCVSVCQSNTLRKSLCTDVLRLFIIKPSFNLLLLAFNIGLTTSFERYYGFKNNFYLPVVLQCAIKVDYLYNELILTDFPKIILEQECVEKENHNANHQKDNHNVNHNVNHQNDSGKDDDFDMLFTMPDIKKVPPKIQSTIMNDLTKNQIKVIVLRNQNQSKDKNVYNISKRV